MPRQYGPAQLAFIKSVRDRVKGSPTKFFAEHCWRDIQPKGGRFDSTLLNTTNNAKHNVEGFNVKSIACWVPHLIFPTHTPHCPHCKSADHVHVDKAKWIGSPKILYGKERHRYLDTMLYPCGACNKTFAGYNKASMQLSGKVVYGFFNFYLGKKYAVDEELHRHIVECGATECTGSIAKRLKAAAYAAYYDDQQLYLSAVGANKIRARPKKKQRLMDAFLPERTMDRKLNTLRRRKTNAGAVTRRLQLSLSIAVRRHQSDLTFTELLKSKKNHNVFGEDNVLAGMGPVALKKCINHALLTCKEVLACDCNEKELKRIKHLLPNYKKRINLYYENLEREVSDLRSDYTDALTDLKDATMALTAYSTPRAANPYILRKRAANTDQGRLSVAEEAEAAAQVEIPEFSRFDDKQGYNARYLSKYGIDQLVAAVFRERKCFIESKMQCLLATMLKVDFNYPLASKIRVWTKQGQSFCPFKCIVTIQNEDGLTVLWKALKHSESFGEIEADLVRLRDRLNRNHYIQYPRPFIGAQEQSVKVIYVDNCCNVCKIVKRCFPGVIILLDAFHWLKRWNKVLVEPNQVQGGVFRSMMSKALFMVGPKEYKEAKERLVTKEAAKKRRTGSPKEPTVKEIRKEARCSIPSKEILRSNVDACLAYFRAKDAQTEHLMCVRREGDDSVMPLRFLKPDCKKVQDRIRDQFKHIDKGCLTDPDHHIVNLFRVNEAGVVYCARGTNSNERDNLDLATLIAATHIGLHRGDRLITGFFERRNHRKAIIRLGAPDHGTYETDKLLAINSYALAVGFKTVPYADVSSPTVTPGADPEFMGFAYDMSQYAAPAIVTNDDDDELAAGLEEDDDEDDEDALEALGGDPELLRILEESGFDLDIEIVFPQEAPAPLEPHEQAAMDLEVLSVPAEQADQVNARAIQHELAKLLPDDVPNESTMDAFKRLTSKAPWIPFRLPNSSSTASAVDEEEARLFAEMETSYKRGQRNNPAPTKKNYHAFARKWNELVHSSFKKWCDGDEDIILPRLKSCLQLQEYYDRKQQLETLNRVVPSEDDPDLDAVRATLRGNRSRLPQPPPPLKVKPTRYVPQPNGITPFGNPTALNASIAVDIVQAQRQAPTVGTTLSAPHVVALPKLPAKRKRPVAKQTFRSRKYCKTCGWLRTQHVVAKEGVAASCQRPYCGRCYTMKQYHVHKGFGPTCTAPVNSYCTGNVAEWYNIPKVGIVEPPVITAITAAFTPTAKKPTPPRRQITPVLKTTPAPQPTETRPTTPPPIVRRITTPPSSPEEELTIEGFNGGIYCITCGFPHSIHKQRDFDELECQRSTCGKCNKHVDQHDFDEMGPRCSMHGSSNEACKANVAGWFKKP